MFDIKSFFKREVEKKLINVDDYIFMPERVEMEIEGGLLNCVLNSDGRVDIFYSKDGVTEVGSASRKHPFTAFEKELYHGIYDDVINDLIKEVDKIIDSTSKYFRRSQSLPFTASITSQPADTNKF
ncbi:MULTISPECIES: hypothetical protein [Psychrobacter]|jgi:hypothetical protein|uniref:Uncharacterized protein n=1 Tax=Psychrobacter proteolyticus TaxID=147825 RepID=A0ABV0D6H1_9GAMM|nr:MULTISPECIES: hypothetical protein [Psychrobacter]MCG3857623.1 hypothetical protein [Psychrobacter sp. Ps2]PKH65084.1 hypothetical protein CXF61_08195 [Psychrobacter sp. 4Dc]